MIKTKVEDPVPEFSYPWLGKSTKYKDLIVLFINDNEGTVITSHPDYIIRSGTYYKHWDMSDFKYVPGLKVILENL